MWSNKSSPTKPVQSRRIPLINITNDVNDRLNAGNPVFNNRILNNSRFSEFFPDFERGKVFHLYTFKSNTNIDVLSYR